MPPAFSANPPKRAQPVPVPVAVDLGPVVVDAPVTGHRSRGAGEGGEVAQPSLDLGEAASPARQVVVAIGDPAAEAPDRALGVGVALEDVVVGAEKVADLAPAAPPVRAQVHAEGQLPGLVEPVFAGPEVAVPEALVDGVAEDGPGGGLAGPQFAAGHQVGVRLLRGNGVQFVPDPLPVEGAVGESPRVAAQAAAAAAATGGAVEDAGQDEALAGGPVPVQVDQRLVVVVLALHDDGAVAGVADPAVVVLLVGGEGRAAPVGVVVHAEARGPAVVDVQGAGVPGVEGGDRLLVEALPVALRGPGHVQVDLVGRGGEEAQGPEIGPRRGPGLVGQAVAGLAREARGKGGPVVDQARRETDGRLVEGVGAGLLHDPESAALPGHVGDDVHRPPDRGDGEVGGAQSPLHLDRRGDIAETVPVRPVDPAALLVVDRDAVDQDRDVALVEAAHVDARVAGAPALLGGVHARGVVEDHRQVPGAELAVHLRLRHVREGHGRLPQPGAVGDDDDLPAPEDLGRQLDQHLHGVRPDEDGKAELPVSDQARDEQLPALADRGDLEPSVEIRGGPLTCAFEVEVRPRQGFPGPGVPHLALQGGGGQGRVGQQERGEGDGQELETRPAACGTAHQRHLSSKTETAVFETSMEVLTRSS